MALRRLFRKVPPSCDEEVLDRLPELIDHLAKVRELCQQGSPKVRHLGLHSTLDSVAALCEAGITSLRKCWDLHSRLSNAPPASIEDSNVWNRKELTEEEGWRPGTPGETKTMAD